MEDGFHRGGSIVRSGQTRAAVPLEAPHEATVCGQVHLRDTFTIECAPSGRVCPYLGRKDAC